ncbi:unnamed protein product [Mytilus coruscus]|uniref:DZIP3-like HEPN domain-containing protein n=1 Tax=Mytilus coruscus TaxID=42192 RepID=A0A6J8E7K1_MYTCO|nr:unnamed protein product [Mytilus coruscus]
MNLQSSSSKQIKQRYGKISMMSIKTFNLKCPSQASWKLRAQVKCNSTLKYFCLYNNVAEKYVEGCNGPDWDRKGSKRIYAGDFSRGECIRKRFQPFIFWTNGSVSDCIYAKSICSAKGQVVYRDNSTKDDRACRCDYEKNYVFIKTPRNFCFYYKCTTSDFQEVTQCKHITSYNITLDEKTGDSNGNIHLSNSQTIAGLLFFFADLFNKWKRKQLQQFIRSSERNNTEQHTITTDEVNFLRMVHLLFSVACSVVRMAFNHEIQPNQLRKTLDRNKTLLEKVYRRKDKIINDFQWNLLFKGETVSSDDFDITLMIYLLRTLANISIGDIYPAPFNTSISAMLTRINYIRNKVIQNVKGQLSEEHFNQYWDDIGQDNTEHALQIIVLDKEIHLI